MWARSDLEDGSNKAGSSGVAPAWTSSHDSSWLGGLQGSGSSGGRRHSAVSDSGDTGIGTYCSDSMEDDSSTSTTPLSFLPLTPYRSGLDEDSIPILHVLPSPSSSPGTHLRKPASPHNTVRRSRSSQLTLPVAASPLGAPLSLDQKDHRPIRKWSSLTKLSSDPASARTSSYQYHPDSYSSLDRGLLYGCGKEPRVPSGDLYLPLSSSYTCSNSLLLRSPGAGPLYRYNRRSTGLDSDLALSSALSTPVKRNNLDLNYSSLPGVKLTNEYSLSLPPAHQTDRNSPIQSALRTQMWLTEQMEYRPKADRGNDSSGSGAEDCGGGNGLSPRQQDLRPNQVHVGTSLPVNTLVKLKEGLLRQRELEIERQKQQILQLHARIRENELRAQQVLQSQKSWYDEHKSSEESAMRTSCMPPSDRLCCDEELGRKLAIAELEVLQLNEFFKHITQKYTEDVRKLEEKVKTRDRYISSLKKKCQRECDQNQEKQLRIETLEKYLSDLPTLDEVQVRTKQGELVQQKAQDLEKTLSWLQKSLQEEFALMKEKDIKIELQAQREKELIGSVHNLEQKVQQCLGDGVRMPMQDLKRLEVENTQLLEERDHSSRLFKHQKEQIERLTSQLTATSARLQKKRSQCHRQQTYLLKEDGPATLNKAFPQQDEGPLGHPLPPVEMSEVGRLLKEMSLCLLDLQGLCSILAQRSQGKEPNLSLLLGMKSWNVSTEESDSKVLVEEEELRFKLLEVGQLRKDIDELRKNISDASLSIWVTSVARNDSHLS